MQVTPPTNMQYFVLEVEPPQPAPPDQETARPTAEAGQGEPGENEDTGADAQGSREGSRGNTTLASGSRVDVFV